MAKKQQFLSPENYIRQRSRNLPIGVCRINKEWKEAGIADVLVSRNHINGNVTYCMYMVDLYCLGIKDTLHRFNESKETFQEFIDDINDAANPMMEISYALAHNIIFTSVEYAEELGFKPHKDFTQTTIFFLEEDTDDVELIEIECGSDGKPLYIQGPNDSTAKAKEIIAQLRKATGSDGYDMILVEDMMDKGEEDEYDENDDEEDLDYGYNKLSFEEKKTIFLAKFENEDEALDIKSITDLEVLTDSLYLDLVSGEKLDDYEMKWAGEYQVDIAEDYFTTGMLGLEEEEIITEEDARGIDSIILGEENKQESLDALKVKWGEFAFAAFADLKYFTEQDSSDYIKKLDAYCKFYPGYALLAIEKYAYSLTRKEATVSEISFEKIFANRTELSGYEMFNFQAQKLKYFIAQKNMEALQAMYYALDDFLWEDEYYPLHRLNVLFGRALVLKEYFRITTT